MVKRGNKLLVILICISILMTFPGCSSKNKTKDDKQVDSTGSSKSTLSGDLEIWAWGADDEAKSRENAIKIFIKEHPELNVTYSIIPTTDGVWDQKSAAALSTGSAPDVIQVSPDYYGMNTQYYLDLNPYVSKDGVKLEDVLVPGVIDGYYDTDGKLEGFPLLANCFVMAYNKDMFDAANVAYPKEGWTMSDLSDWGTAFVSGEGANKTYAMAKHWVLNNIMLYACGGTPYTNDLSKSNMGSKQIVDSLTLYKKLIDTSVIPDDTVQKTIPAATLFVSGKVAMYPTGGFETLAVTNDAKENGLNIGFCPMPCDSDGNEINIQYATGYAITKTSKNPDAAWQFLKESAYANDEMAKQTAMCGMPASKKVASSYYNSITFKGENLDNSYYVEHMGKSHLNPFGGTLSSTGDLWKTAVEAVLLDNQDPQKVVDKYAPQIEKEFSSYFFNKK